MIPDSSHIERESPNAQQGAQSLKGQTLSEASASPSPDTRNRTSSEIGEVPADNEDVMLLRDLPKRSTFYDPVAERQMSQTDAKLFYQRSKIDSRGHAGHSRFQPGSNDGSTTMSGARPSTEHKFDSLAPREGSLSTAFQLPLVGGKELTKLEDDTRSAESSYTLRDPTSDLSHKISATNHRLRSGSTYANEGQFIAEQGLGPFSNNTTFDTEPHITAELSHISKNIQKVLDVRRKYITLSSQGPDDNPRDQEDWEVYPPPPEPAWAHTREGESGFSDAPISAEPGWAERLATRKRKPGQDVGEDFKMDDLLPLPGEDERNFGLDDSGVYQVFIDDKDKIPALKVPTIREFYMDLDNILTVSSDGPSKSFAFRRLQYLEAKFNLYVLLNEYQETADSKKVPHRDFYNVRKVDTHVHHSACMNQKHLLRFIKSKMKKYPNEVVLFRDGKHLTLAEVFSSINLTAYDLSIDTLDMHVCLKST